MRETFGSSVRDLPRDWTARDSRHEVVYHWIGVEVYRKSTGRQQALT